MPQEIVVFWRHGDGTRCVVLQKRPPGTGWQLRVTREQQVLLEEDFADPRVLYERAESLRTIFRYTAA